MGGSAGSANYLLSNGINIFFDILYALVFVRILLSWFPINQRSSLVVLLKTLTDPILEPIRKMVAKSPLGGGGAILDFSPVIALFLLSLVKSILLSII